MQDSDSELATTRLTLDSKPSRVTRIKNAALAAATDTENICPVTQTAMSLEG